MLFDWCTLLWVHLLQTVLQYYLENFHSISGRFGRVIPVHVAYRDTKIVPAEFAETSRQRARNIIFFSDNYMLSFMLMNLSCLLWVRRSRETVNGQLIPFLFCRLQELAGLMADDFEIGPVSLSYNHYRLGRHCLQWFGEAKISPYNT